MKKERKKGGQQLRNTALVVTCSTVSEDLPPRRQRALIRNIKNCWSHIFTTVRSRKKKERKKSLGHNHKKKWWWGGILCGYMWNDPGSPWHAQTGAPPLCRFQVSVWWEERGRTLLCAQGERKKNAELSN